MGFNTFMEITRSLVKKQIIDSTRKNRENGSFSELLFENISIQSVNIKMGIVIEKAWNAFLDTIDGVEKVKKIDAIDNQIDILFTYKNTIYYFECKNNINLDTEKTIYTYNKVKRIQNILEKTYKSVVAKILVNRYSNTNTIKFYKRPIDKNILAGYNDMFNIFGIQVNEKEWADFFKSIGKYILGGK